MGGFFYPSSALISLILSRSEDAGGGRRARRSGGALLARIANATSFPKNRRGDPIMNPSAVSALVFVCLFGVGFLATRLRAMLPEHHLGTDTKDTVKLAMGLVATMTALVLGLLVASAKGSYDAEKSGVVTMSAKLVMLDKELAHYGPEAAPARGLLRDAVGGMAARLWPNARSKAAQLDPSGNAGDALFDAIENLSPQNDAQRSLKSQAQGGAIDLGQMRWLLFEQSGTSISTPLLAVVI
jgi:hypothetical protein